MQTNDIFNHLLSSDRAGREVNDDQLNNIHPHCLHTSSWPMATGLLIRSGATWAEPWLGWSHHRSQLV